MLYLHQNRQFFPFFIIFALVFFACSTRSYTKSRSDIIAEAKNQGAEVGTIQEDNEKFLQEEQATVAELEKLLQQRNAARFTDSTYLIGPGDEFKINVFDVPELNIAVRVREGGTIALPLIGSLKVVGMSEVDLLNTITRRLRQYVHSPQVSVYITNYGSQKVSVIGAVNVPGLYPLTKNSNSLLELLSKAGGLSDKSANYINFVPSEFNAEMSKASISLVQGPDMSNSVEIDLDFIMGTGGRIPINLPVYDGDLIIVPEAGNVTVEGEVEQNGVYAISKGSTLASALAHAGGLRYSARLDEVELIRHLNTGDKKRLVINLEDIALGKINDIKLRNGDIIRVPTHSGRRMESDIFETVSRFVNFGVRGDVGR